MDPQPGRGASALRDEPVPGAAPPPGLRRIWLCADDYGLAPGVNAAIRDLIAHGRLNATSVMMVAPSASSAEVAALAGLKATAPQVAVGLHLTLTAPFRPLSDALPPFGATLPRLGPLLLAALLRRLDPGALEAEVAAQLAAFRDAFGRPPDFIDGHQHVHLFPQIRDAVLKVARHAAPSAWLRQCGSATPVATRLADGKGLLIALFSAAFRRRAQALAVPTNPAFAGTYAFTPDADFAALFPRFLDRLPDGGLIMCHPGQVDPELIRLDPLTHLREREYAYLAGDTFPALLAARGVSLR